MKGLIFENISIKPWDSINELKKKIEFLMKGRNNPIEKWDQDLNVILKGPLVTDEAMPEESKLEDADQNSLDQTVQIKDYKQPFQTWSIQNGSTISFNGEIMLESEKPRSCMSLGFDPAKKEEFTFYSCEECKIKWICESCMEGCHKTRGHTVKIFVENEVVDWAICYCVKKKKCMIPNKKNPVGI